ncbi:MAG: DedA family protein [Sulfurospirillum sp.]|nr:MAG: DedA family protein [Sulfurospirillum sp.]
MEDIFHSLTTYGYIALFLYSLGGGFFGLVAAGALSYLGKMDIVISMLVVFVANYLGDMVLFYMARYNKEMIAPYMKSHRRKFALSHLLVKKYGDFAVFIQKFIYGVKTLVPIAMGLSKYSFVKFGLLNIPATALFVLFFGVLSYKGGEHIVALFGKLKETPWILPLVLVTLIGGLWYYFERVTKKR